MQLSNRITTLTGGGSDGWDLFLRARDMIASGIDVTELTIGEHDIKTHDDILDAMHASAKSGRTGYSMVPGEDTLRDAVAARTQAATGVPTTRENVLITPGGQSALFSAHTAVCDAGDTALYIDPYYATYPGVIRSAGAIPVTIPALPENNFQVRREDIDAAAKSVKNAKSLLVNSPNNPTGVVYSRATFDGIAQATIENDLWLISDEVYDTQIWEGTHISPRALPDMAQRTLVIGSMSKSHAMTGSRVGWIIAPENVVENLITLATHTTYGVAGFVQDAAHYALNIGPQFEAAVAVPFLRRRDLSLAILARQNVVRAVPPQGAMYLMLDIRATGLSGEEFANQLLDAHHIAVMPGESFGHAAAGHIRVAMTINDDRFAAALETLCDFAKTLVKS